MKHVRAISLCAAIAVTVTTPAFGRSAPVFVTAPVDVVTRHISYADLNLASVPGERALQRRVGTAVTDLCLDATGGNDGSPQFKLSMIRCSGEAWSGARPQMARAVQRARDIAATGSSSIVAAALTISLPK
jgi:UrcA family protein